MSRTFSSFLGGALAALVFTATLFSASPAAAQSSGLGVLEEGHSAPRFYGFAFDFTVNDSSGLNSVGQNYRNDLSFYFEPTWNFGKVFFRNSKHWKGLHLAARFIVTQNLSGVDDSNFSGNTMANPQGTCSDITPSTNGGVIDPTQVKYCNPPSAQRRTDYSDLWLTLRAPKVVTIPKLGVHFNPSIRFIFPTSMQSRFSTMVMSITGFLGLTRNFWKDRIRTGYTFGFNKYIHQYTTSGVTYTTGGSSSAQGGNSFDGSVGAGISNFLADPSRSGPESGTNPSFAIQNILSFGAQLHPKVSFDLLYITVNTFAYGQPCVVEVNGMQVDTCVSGNTVAASSGSSLNRPGRRDSQVLWASLSYNPLDYLTLTLSWINAAPMYNRDSTYRQGIISTNYDAFTSVSLGATVSLEGVAAKIWKKK